MFVIGADEDTKNTIDETFEFAKRYGLDSVQFAILTPLVGSEIYQDFRKKNRITTYDWGLYDSHHVTYIPENMTSFELQDGVDRILKKFYSNSYLFKLLLKNPREVPFIIKSVSNIRKYNKDKSNITLKNSLEFFNEIEKRASEMYSNFIGKVKNVNQDTIIEYIKKAGEMINDREKSYKKISGQYINALLNFYENKIKGMHQAH